VGYDECREGHNPFTIMYEFGDLISIWAHSSVCGFGLGTCNSDISMLGLGDGDIHMLLLGLDLSLSDVVRLLLSDGDIVLLNLGFSDVVRFLDGLVHLIGDGDVVRYLDGVGAVVGISVGLHVVVCAWHHFLNCGDVGLGNSIGVVSNLGLIDDLVWEGLGDELVLNNGGGVVQGFCYILVQSCWHVLSSCFPLCVVLHLCIGDSLVHSLVVALLGAGVLGCRGRAIARLWFRWGWGTIGWSRFGWGTIVGWRTSSWVIGCSDRDCHQGS